MKKKKKLSKIFKKRAWFETESKQATNLFSKLFHLRISKFILGALIAIIIAPLALFLAFKPKIQEDINYGITFSNKYASDLGMDWKDTYLNIIDDLGAKNLRLIAYWDDIEQVKDVYDYSDIDWQLAEANKRGINVIMTIGRKVPRYPECFEPGWWNEIEKEHIRDFELYEYLKETVNHLKWNPSIVMWQVENEPFFPFGECKYEIKYATVKEEVSLTRDLDDRPILTQDSGEGGSWLPTYRLGDYLGISMYRKIWFDFWGVFGGNSIYFKYPLAHWTYAIKAAVTQVPHQRIVVTELQGEPWGPRINSELTEEQKSKTMSKNDFLDALSYAQKAGFKDIYVWGAEWWLWEKNVNGNQFYWNTAKALFN